MMATVAMAMPVMVVMMTTMVVMTVALGVVVVATVVVVTMAIVVVMAVAMAPVVVLVVRIPWMGQGRCGENHGSRRNGRQQPIAYRAGHECGLLKLPA